MSELRGTPSRLLIVLAFLSLYSCWSATYAAMRIGAELLPATVFAGVRMLIGAVIMLAFCALRGRRIFFCRHIMARLMLLGVMLLFGGNIGLVWSEKYLPSGFTALIVAVVPLYVVLIELALPDGNRPSNQGYLGLTLGFCAMVALVWPSLRNGLGGHPMEMLAIVAILAGAFSWASGSVLSRQMNLPVDPLVAAGWEMFAAGVADVLCATCFHQWRHAVWNLRSASCIGFLVLFGSLLGYTSYIWLITYVPIAKVTTYAYVNPMIAVLLGVVVLHEKLTASECFGMMAIMVSVALVTSSKFSSGREIEQAKCVPVESEAYP